MSQRPRPVLPRVMLISIAIAVLLAFLVLAVGCDNIIIISNGSSSSSPSKPPALEGELEFDFELDDRKPLDVSLFATATIINSDEIGLESGDEVSQTTMDLLTVTAEAADSNHSDYEYRWYINTELRAGEAEATIELAPALLELGPVAITVLVIGEHVIGSDSMRFRVVP